jgi:hypothetical protein
MAISKTTTTTTTAILEKYNDLFRRLTKRETANLNISGEKLQ